MMLMLILSAFLKAVEFQTCGINSALYSLPVTQDISQSLSLSICQAEAVNGANLLFSGFLVAEEVLAGSVGAAFKCPTTT